MYADSTKMKAQKCKTLGAELAMHIHRTVPIIKPLHVDDHLPTMDTQYTSAFYVDDRLPILLARR